VKNWYADCLELTPKNSLIVLAGNKCDLHKE
jgi:hypothetical protein